MRRRSMLFAFVLRGVTALGTGVFAAIDVPLTVEEPIGAERGPEVVSGGIPLPQGQYKDPAVFSLFEGARLRVAPALSQE